METSIKRIYTCAQIILYAICRFAWALYAQYLKDFSGFSDKYDEQYGLDALAAVTAAEDMPDQHSRQGALNSLFDNLKTTAALCVENFDALLRYINDAFTTTAQKEAAKQQAGAEYYEKAAAGNVNELTAMLKSAATFVAANSDVLQKGGKGMPKAFPDTLSGNKKAFNNMLDKYNAAKKSAEEATAAKVEANNEIYTTMKNMFDDAKTIYKKNKTLQATFNYNAVKNVVSPGIRSGIHFTVQDAATEKPVASQATIDVVGTDISRTTNKRGVLDLRLATGKHTITVKVPGYQSYTGGVTVDTGIMHREVIKLKKEAE